MDDATRHRQLRAATIWSRRSGELHSLASVLRIANANKHNTLNLDTLAEQLDKIATDIDTEIAEELAPADL